MAVADINSGSTPDVPASELARFDAVALAAMVRAGELHPAEIIDDTIQRMERLNPHVNAVIHPAFEQARRIAAGNLPDGPFRGVPMLLKDLWPSSTGDPYHLGVKALKDAGHTGDHDANIVTAYREAGFVICGRTNTPEFGLVATTEPEAYGATHNPWDLTRGPGGSSGGSAAAVASGMVPAANASDGGGSIRIPAAMCGLVGLKPSRGRVSMGPDQDEWGRLVQHVVCHTVRDSAAILDATARPFPGDGVIAPSVGRPYLDQVGRDPGCLRFGFVDHSLWPGTEVASEIVKAVRDTARILEELGHSVDQSHPEALADPRMVGDFNAVSRVGVSASLRKISLWLGRDVTEDDVEAATWFIGHFGDSVTGTELIDAQAAQMTYRRGVAQWWATGHDILVTPTCMKTAPRLGELVGTPEDPIRGLRESLPYAAFTAPFNTTGQPAISLPIALSTAGLPIGVQLVADYGREDLLISVAAQLEAEIHWSSRRAPIHP